MDSKEALAVLKSVVARSELLLDGAGPKSVERLVQLACQSDPSGVPALLADAGKYREAVLRGLAAAQVDPGSPGGQLSENDKAVYAVARLTENSHHATPEAADAAVQGALELNTDRSDPLTKSLLRFFTTGGAEPETGLRSALRLPAGLARDAFVNSLITKWAAVDVVGASKVLAALPSGTIPDTAIVALAGEIRQDPEAVVAWANDRFIMELGRHSPESLKLVLDALPEGFERQRLAQIALAGAGDNVELRASTQKALPVSESLSAARRPLKNDIETKIIFGGDSGAAYSFAAASDKEHQPFLIRHAVEFTMAARGTEGLQVRIVQSPLASRPRAMVIMFVRPFRID